MQPSYLDTTSNNHSTPILSVALTLPCFALQEEVAALPGLVPLETELFVLSCMLQ